MLSNTVSGFIFTSLYKISNHLKPSQSQTPFSFTRILFCDHFDLFFSFSFYKICKYTKIYTKIPTNKTANNNKKLKKY